MSSHWSAPAGEPRRGPERSARPWYRRRRFLIPLALLVLVPVARGGAEQGGEVQIRESAQRVTEAPDPPGEQAEPSADSDVRACACCHPCAPGPSPRLLHRSLSRLHRHRLRQSCLPLPRRLSHHRPSGADPRPCTIPASGCVEGARHGDRAGAVHDPRKRLRRTCTSEWRRGRSGRGRCRRRRARAARAERCDQPSGRSPGGWPVSKKGANQPSDPTGAPSVSRGA